MSKPFYDPSLSVSRIELDGMAAVGVISSEDARITESVIKLTFTIKQITVTSVLIISEGVKIFEMDEMSICSWYLTLLGNG